MIDNYTFGSITINDKTYDHDVEIDWKGEVLKWWRKEGHVIAPDDVQRAITKNPEAIVIGTGESGAAKVTDTTKKEIESKGIELIIDLTGEATKTLNKLKDEKKKVIGLFHLTC